MGPGKLPAVELRHISSRRRSSTMLCCTCQWLSGIGFEVTVVPCDEHGMIDPGAIQRAVRSSTSLISVMYANNEIGAYPADQ